MFIYFQQSLVSFFCFEEIQITFQGVYTFITLGGYTKCTLQKYDPFSLDLRFNESVKFSF
jgi:hypothetical protein